MVNTCTIFPQLVAYGKDAKTPDSVADKPENYPRGTKNVFDNTRFLGLEAWPQLHKEIIECLHGCDELVLRGDKKKSGLGPVTWTLCCKGRL